MLKRYYNTLKNKNLENSKQAKTILYMATNTLASIFLSLSISKFWNKESIALTIALLALSVLLVALELIYGLLKRRDSEKPFDEFVIAGIWAFVTLGQVDILISLLVAV